MASLKKTGKYWRLSIKVAGKLERPQFSTLSSPSARNQLLALANELESNHSTGAPNRPETNEKIQLLAPAIKKRFIEIGLLGQTAIRKNFKLREFLDECLAEARERFNAREITVETLGKWENTCKHACKFFGNKTDIRRMTLSDAERYRNHRLNTDKMARDTVLSEIKHLRSFFKKAPSNPFQECEVKIPKQRKDPRRKYLDVGELDQVEVGIQDINWRTLFSICRWTGCRVSEALKLKWSGIDWNFKVNGKVVGQITMPSPKTAKKGRTERQLPLFKQLRPALESLYREQGEPTGDSYVIQGILNLPKIGREDTSRPAKNAGTTMKKLIEKCDVKPWVKIFHNLRVTRENELLQSAEYRREAIHEFIGHSKEVFDANYSELNDDDFIPKSQRGSAVSGEADSTIFPPRKAHAEARNCESTSGHGYQNKNLLGIASNCNPSRLSNAPRLGLEPRT